MNRLLRRGEGWKKNGIGKLIGIMTEIEKEIYGILS